MDFEGRTARLDERLGIGRSFDMTGRWLGIGGRAARLWVVGGYADEIMLERILATWMVLPDLAAFPTAGAFVARCISASGARTEPDETAAVTAVFSGSTLLCIDGYEELILLEARKYPGRSVKEPDTSKVLRGSHDGFLENIMQNAALLRRRIRSEDLVLERVQLQGRSKTDVALCYMAGEAREDHLDKLRQKLQAIDVGSISMSQESIAECLVPKQWWNPFPKVRYTERPDVATAAVMEGTILLLIDNTPCVMLLPTTFFSFAEEVNDYYFPPIIGTYLQIVRLVVLFLAQFITPLWYLLVRNPDRLHESLHFLLIHDEYYVPLFIQLLLVEFIVDVLKLASLNTPQSLSSSFSMLGALILGDFAVQSRWLVPEVLVYMAFVAIVNYAQHSYELGYASKLCRMGLLVLIALLDIWGFVLGVIGILALIASTKTILGDSYLYPLIPYNGKLMRRLLHRPPISRENT